MTHHGFEGRIQFPNGFAVARYLTWFAEEISVPLCVDVYTLVMFRKAWCTRPKYVRILDEVKI
jgi:hypothetical protein